MGLLNFKKYCSESFINHSIVPEGRGSFIYYKNPTQQQLFNIVKKIKEVRFVIDDNFDIYIWDAMELIHSQFCFMNNIELDLNDESKYGYMRYINEIIEFLPYDTNSEKKVIKKLKQKFGYTISNNKFFTKSITKSINETYEQKLGNLISIKIGDKNADFWIVRRGDINKVGTPTKTYNSQAYGIKVTDRTQILPDYLYYYFMYIQQTGYWKNMAHGTTKLVNIKLNDIKNIEVARS